MTRTVTSARLKIDRAYHHLETLEGKVRIFFERDPYPIRYEFNVDRTECRLYISIAKALPEQAWGLIIGDCVHNARSALDHLVWELSEVSTGPDPSDTDSQFPIYDRANLFYQHAGRRIRRLPVEFQTLVEQLQPYHSQSPQGHPLWLCHDLNNIDKHKIIPVIVAAVQQPHVSVSAGRLPVTEVKFTTGPFIHNAEVGFIRFATPADPDVQVYSAFSVVETLSSSPPYIDSRHTLRRILHNVARIIDAFEAFPNHHSILPVVT
jgi:hypothetical protein